MAKSGPEPKKYVAERRAKVVELKARGFSHSDISRLLMVKVNTIHADVRRMRDGNFHTLNEEGLLVPAPKA